MKCVSKHACFPTILLQTFDFDRSINYIPAIKQNYTVMGFGYEKNHAIAYKNCKNNQNQLNQPQ